uniref:EF-hand domain-containing protein n=1 Tax=Ditylenchus dipsaci TaxID=166011 RepID=A0A915DR08_9BILA
MPSVRINLRKKISLNSSCKTKSFAQTIGSAEECTPNTTGAQQSFTENTPQQYFGPGLTEADANSLNELIKFEPAKRPPTLGQLREFTSNRFSDKWIKYMYAKFKNECPAGRMKLTEFKLLFGPYVPDRMSDAYLEKMFNAFCYTSPYADHLTFKDLIECLSILCDQDAHSHAMWTMRLINGQRADQITLAEFNEFVKSIFLLVGHGEQRRKRMGSIWGGSKDSKAPPALSVSTLPVLTSAQVVTVDRDTLKAIQKRAERVFKELDVEGQGFLTIQSLEELFRIKEADSAEKQNSSISTK